MFLPGSVSILLEVVRLRVPVLCIFRNGNHRDVVLEHLAELLKPLMMDPTDVRFFRADTVVGVDQAQTQFSLALYSGSRSRNLRAGTRDFADARSVGVGATDFDARSVGVESTSSDSCCDRERGISKARWVGVPWHGY